MNTHRDGHSLYRLETVVLGLQMWFQHCEKEQVKLNEVERHSILVLKLLLRR